MTQHQTNVRPPLPPQTQDELTATGKSFKPHPPGQFAARCCDVVFRGYHDQVWQGKTRKVAKISLHFITTATMEDGRPFAIQRWFTRSMGENAALRAFLQAWRGGPFTDDEAAAFNLDRLVGAPALLQITHATENGKVYANINAVMGLPQGMPAPVIPADYVRMRDRPVEAPPAPSTTSAARPGGFTPVPAAARAALDLERSEAFGEFPTDAPSMDKPYSDDGLPF